jgi:hypothetical protein
MPALVPSSSRRGGQFLLDQLFDEAPDPIPGSRLDRVGPSFPRNSVASSTGDVLSVVMA